MSDSITYSLVMIHFIYDVLKLRSSEFQTYVYFMNHHQTICSLKSIALYLNIVEADYEDMGAQRV